MSNFTNKKSESSIYKRGLMMVNDDDVYEYGLASGAHSRDSGRLVEAFGQRL